MTQPTGPDSAAEVLLHLVRFAEDPEEVFTMSDDQVQGYLVQEDMDVAAKMREFGRRMDSLRGAQKLARAGVQRRQAQQKLQVPSTRISDDPERVRAEVIRRISLLGPDRAHAYFRKLETADPSDLERLLQDLELLETLGEHEPGEKRA